MILLDIKKMLVQSSLNIELYFKLMNDQDLLDWVNENVSFPNSMVDRITPATVDLDRHNLQANFGINDEWPVVCESFIQWVIENDFKKVSRPSWELVGAKLVDDVVPYENMKLMLLNAGHSVLGILGMLLKKRFIHYLSSSRYF